MVATLLAPETMEALAQPVGTLRTYGIEVECEVDEQYLGGGEGEYEELTGTFTHPITGEHFTAECEVYVEPVGGDFVDEVESLSSRWGGWDVREDGSLESDEGGEMRECVSGVLRGSEGLATIVDFSKILRSYDVTVNDTCGLHVHVGLQHADGTRATTRQLDLLDEVFEIFEYAFYGTAGDRAPVRVSGSETGHWCKPKRDADSDYDRYRALNLTNARRHGDTFEVRAFGPTTDALDIIAAVCMAVGIGQCVFSGDAARAALPERSEDPRVAMRAFWQLVQPKHMPALPEGVTLDKVQARCFANARDAAYALDC